MELKFVFQEGAKLVLFVFCSVDFYVSQIL